MVDTDEAAEIYTLVIKAREAEAAAIAAGKANWEARETWGKTEAAAEVANRAFREARAEVVKRIYLSPYAGSFHIGDLQPLVTERSVWSWRRFRFITVTGRVGETR